MMRKSAAMEITFAADEMLERFGKRAAVQAADWANEAYNRGDFGTLAAACLPDHKLGQDGTPGECPQSYGILQNRYPYENGGWPAIARSTAMNADAAYAIWRACFDGYEVWKS